MVGLVVLSIKNTGTPVEVSYGTVTNEEVNLEELLESQFLGKTVRVTVEEI